jgi:type IV pilus assembly protein PilV
MIKLNKKKNNYGFYTIEAIVAIIIFMVGIIGIIEIQTIAIKANSDAQYKVNASYFADEIIGEMMVNKPVIMAYANGTNTNYQKWLGELTKSIPGVSKNPPTITVVSAGTSSGPTGTTYLVTVIINWKKPGDSTISQYRAETTIL